MANEFVAKNGLISQNNSVVTGSLIVTNGITGSLLGTATNALTASYLSGYVSPFPFTGSAIISGSLRVTGSINGLTVSGIDSTSGSVAVGIRALASNVFSSGMSPTGIDNIAVGNSALLANTTGSYNIAIGKDAGSYLQATNETITTPINTPLSGNLLANNPEEEGDTLTIVESTINGTTYPAGSIIDIPSVGTYIINVDGTFTFSPNRDYSGVVPTITYIVSDGNGGTTEETLIMTVGTVDPTVIPNGNSKTNRSVFIGSETRALANGQTNQIVIGNQTTGAGSNTVTIGNVDITTTRLRGEVQGGSFVKDGGTSDQYLRADGSVSTALNTRIETTYTASAGQTIFPLTYEVGQLEVFYNGSKLYPNEFTASNGTSFMLSTGATEGAQISAVKYVSTLTTAAVRTETTFITTLNQTTFTVNYTPGQVDVYYNGAKLSISEFTATNGTSVVLGFACAADESVSIISYVSQVSGVSGSAGYIPKLTGAATMDNSNIFQSGSNIGIRTTTPSLPLEVSGSSRFTVGTGATIDMTSPGGATGIVYNTSATNNYSRFNTYNSPNAISASRYFALEWDDTGAGLRIMKSGNVGIGTINATSLLHLSTAAGTGTSILKLANTSGASASNIVRQEFIIGNSFGGAETVAYITALNPNATANNGGALTFSTSANGTGTTPTERMRIDSNYITTSNVFESFNTASGLHFGTVGSGGSFGFIKWDAGGSYVYIGNSYNSAFNRDLVISSTGKVGIGTTSPGQPLDVVGNVRGTGLLINNATGNQQLSFQKNASMRYAIGTEVGAGSTNDWSIYNYIAGATSFIVYGNNNYQFYGSNVSDIRAKQDIQDLDFNATEKIAELRPKSYYMKNDPNQIRYGLIAQDVHETLPDLVCGDLEGEGFIGLDYNGMIPVLVKAIQELKAEIEILKNK